MENTQGMIDLLMKNLDWFSWKKMILKKDI